MGEFSTTKRFVSNDTNTNFGAQNPFHNLIVCVFEHKLDEFVRRSDAAYQSFLDTQTQTYVTIQNLTYKWHPPDSIPFA